MRVEQCWHTVKGGLRTRPIFHWTPHRICAHVSLCVLALLGRSRNKGPLGVFGAVASF